MNCVLSSASLQFCLKAFQVLRNSAVESGRFNSLRMCTSGNCEQISVFKFCNYINLLFPLASQCRLGLNHEVSSPAKTLGSWVRITFEA
jgi:hypothetical protein